MCQYPITSMLPNNIYKRSETCTHFYHLSLLCTFIILNILLTPVALAKSVSLYYPKIIAESSTGDFMGCLYWQWLSWLSSSMFHTLLLQLDINFNLPAITSCIMHSNCSSPSDTNINKDEIGTLISSGHSHPSCSVHRTAAFHLCCEVYL